MQSISGPAGNFGYSYASANNQYLLAGITLPNGASITNQYDGLGRMTGTALQDHWGHVLDGYAYGIDLLGLRTNITRQLGLSTNYVSIGYDPISQVTNWNGTEPGGAGRENEELSYSYDAAGNLRVRTNNALVQTFTANPLNQLTNVARSGTFTFAGALPAPPASVMVSGAVAQTNGDFTFAAQGITLTNGANTFTVIAENLYGTNTTNIVTATLPTTVTLQYDANGNLTNDGTRVFQYDAENQLTNVYVTNAWRVGFIYDGLNRRRVEMDYAWQGGWVLTNGINCIFDGNEIIQERTTNNSVAVTYTRGLDLSGSLQGAGGIGGLLARTDANGSVFYHADGGGNVTGLMDVNQRMVARYGYGPFGQMINARVPYASLNRMQFSSMPAIPGGLIGYPWRVYNVNPPMRTTPDPIGEAGGINLYQFIGNNPVNYVDPYGLQPSTLTDPDDDALDQALANGATPGSAFAGAGAAAVTGTKQMLSTAGSALVNAAMMVPFGAEEGVYSAGAKAVEEAEAAKKVSDLAKLVKKAKDELCVTDRVARRHLRDALGKGSGEAHHIIPWAARDNPLVVKAAEGGFNINGVENGVYLAEQHAVGGHPEYNDAVVEAIRGYNSLNPNMTPDQAAQLLKTFANSLRNDLLNGTMPLK